LPADNEVIDCRGLSYMYPGALADALSSIDVTFEKGRMYTLLGRNGSGKSTLAMCLSGLLLPSRGSVNSVGHDTRDEAGEEDVDIRGRLGMVFQDPDTQMVAMSVEEEVAFGPENLGLGLTEIRSRVESMLSRVGLDDLRSRQPLRLSQGQKQLTAIAGALAMEPSFLISDESTSMLDHASRSRILELFAGLRDDGMGIIHVTHFIGEAVGADHVIVLDAGRIALQGPPVEVLSDPDRLVELGLEPLPVTTIARDLARRGYDPPEGVLDGKELLAWLGG
jgi:energy-coupling factor transport system ATP-binding protein